MSAEENQDTKKVEIRCVGFKADTFGPEEWNLFTDQIKRLYVDFIRIANPRLNLWRERYKKTTNGVIDSNKNDYSEFIRDYMMQICGIINESKLKTSQVECWIERKEVDKDEFLWLPMFAVRFKNHPEKYAYVSPIKNDTDAE